MSTLVYIIKKNCTRGGLVKPNKKKQQHVNSPWAFHPPLPYKLYVGIFRTWKSNRSVHFRFDVINAILSYTKIPILWNGKRENHLIRVCERFLNENGKFIVVSESLNSRLLWNRNFSSPFRIFSFRLFFLHCILSWGGCEFSFIVEYHCVLRNLMVAGSNKIGKSYKKISIVERLFFFVKIYICGENSLIWKETFCLKLKKINRDFFKWNFKPYIQVKWSVYLTSFLKGITKIAKKKKRFNCTLGIHCCM